MYTYSIIITRNGQEIKKFLDFLPVLSIYFSIECQLLLEVKINGKEIEEMSWDNETTVETVCLLGNRNAKPDTRVKLSVDTEELQRVKNGEKI